MPVERNYGLHPTSELLAARINDTPQSIAITRVAMMDPRMESTAKF
jgi:hypothetical protein